MAYNISISDSTISGLAPSHVDSAMAGSVRERSTERSRNRRSKHRREISEDAACELAASKLFRRLDSHSRGHVEEGQVLLLWPELARHMEGTNAAGMAASLQQRSAPISRDEWMTLMGAIQSIVGPRLFRSSVRAAQEHLEHQPRCLSPVNVKNLTSKSQDAYLPGAVEPLPQRTDLSVAQKTSCVDNGSLEVRPRCLDFEGAQPKAPPEAPRKSATFKEEPAEVVEIAKSVCRPPAPDEWLEGASDTDDEEVASFTYYAGRLVPEKESLSQHTERATQKKRRTLTIADQAQKRRQPEQIEPNSPTFKSGENVLVEEKRGSSAPKISLFLPGHSHTDLPSREGEAAQPEADNVADDAKAGQTQEAPEAEQVPSVTEPAQADLDKKTGALKEGERQAAEAPAQATAQAEAARLAAEAAEAEQERQATDVARKLEEVRLLGLAAEQATEEEAKDLARKAEEASVEAEASKATQARLVKEAALQAAQAQRAVEAEAAAEQQVESSHLATEVAEAEQVAEFTINIAEQACVASEVAEAVGNAEQQRQVAALEKDRLAEEASKAEKTRVAVETARLEQERRLAEARTQAEATRLAVEASEAERESLVADAAAKAEQASVLAALADHATGTEFAELAAKAEQALLAAESAKAEQDRHACALEEAHRLAEAAHAEEQRQAEVSQKVSLAAKAAAAEESRLAAETAQVEQQRLAADASAKAEEARLLVLQAKQAKGAEAEELTAKAKQAESEAESAKAEQQRQAAEAEKVCRSAEADMARSLVADAARQEEAEAAAQIEATRLSEEANILSVQASSAEGPEAADLAAKAEKARLAAEAAQADLAQQALDAEQARRVAEAAVPEQQRQALIEETRLAADAVSAEASQERQASNTDQDRKATAQGKDSTLAVEDVHAEQQQLAAQAAAMADEAHQLEMQAERATGAEKAKLAANARKARLAAEQQQSAAQAAAMADEAHQLEMQAERATGAEKAKLAAKARKARLAADKAKDMAKREAARTKMERQEAEMEEARHHRQAEAAKGNKNRKAHEAAKAEQARLVAESHAHEQAEAARVAAMAKQLKLKKQAAVAVERDEEARLLALQAAQAQGAEAVELAAKAEEARLAAAAANAERERIAVEAEQGHRLADAASAQAERLANGDDEEQSAKEAELLVRSLDEAHVAADAAQVEQDEQAAKAAVQAEQARLAAEATKEVLRGQASEAAAKAEEAQLLEIQAAQANGAEAAELNAKAKEARLAAEAANEEQERLESEAAAQAEQARLAAEAAEEQQQEAEFKRLAAERHERQLLAKHEKKAAEIAAKAAEEQPAADQLPGLPSEPPRLPGRAQDLLELDGPPALPPGGKELPPDLPRGGKELPAEADGEEIPGLPKAAKELPPDLPDEGSKELPPGPPRVQREAYDEDLEDSNNKASAANKIGVAFTKDMQGMLDQSQSLGRRDSVPEDSDELPPRAKTPMDEKGRTAADVAEEEAFTRSYNEIRAKRQLKAKEEATHRRMKEAGGDEAKSEQSEKETLLEELRPGDFIDCSALEGCGRRDRKSSKRHHTDHRHGSSHGSQETPPLQQPEPEEKKLSSANRGHGWLMGTLTESEVTPLSTDKGGVKLPKLVHSQTSPGNLEQVDAAALRKAEDDLLIVRLQDELAGERLEREYMSNRLTELEGALAKKLRRSASQPAAKASKATPYRGSPLPPPPASSPNRTRAIQLPALRTIPHAPNPQRSIDERAAMASASSSMERSRNTELSRSERSKSRIEAVEEKTRLGLNTWKERKAEKVSRLKDLTVFRDSMWGSFYEWHEEYSLTE